MLWRGTVIAGQGGYTAVRLTDPSQKQTMAGTKSPVGIDRARHQDLTGRNHHVWWLGCTGSEQPHGFFIDRAQAAESIIVVDSRGVDALPSAAVLRPRSGLLLTHAAGTRAGAAAWHVPRACCYPGGAIPGSYDLL